VNSGQRPCAVLRSHILPELQVRCSLTRSPNHPQSNTTTFEGSKPYQYVVESVPLIRTILH
jgi:hypothetical protein